jgi:hypothetical protein
MDETPDLGEQILAEAQALAQTGVPPPIVEEPKKSPEDRLAELEAFMEKVKAHFKQVLHIDL